jgi:hypothetical protein
MMVSIILLAGLALAIAVSLVVNRKQKLRLARAERKGMELLLRNLSTRQVEQYKSFGYFDVVGSDSGRRYRIFHGRFGNGRELGPNDRLNIGKCFLPDGDLVAGDCMLAQKITLENRESEALRVALPF